MGSELFAEGLLCGTMCRWGCPPRPSLGSTTPTPQQEANRLRLNGVPGVSFSSLLRILCQYSCEIRTSLLDLFAFEWRTHFYIPDRGSEVSSHTAVSNSPLARPPSSSSPILPTKDSQLCVCVCVCVCVCARAHSVMSDSLWPHGL